MDENNQLENFPYLTKRCDIKEIKNVHIINLKDLTIINRIDVGSRYKNIVDYFKKKQIPFTLTNNIKEFSHIPFGKSEVILLPVKKATTFNREPVAFVCSLRNLNSKSEPIINSCHTRYQHPSSIWLSYHVNRKLISDDALLKYDQQQRKRVQELLIDTVPSR